MPPAKKTAPKATPDAPAATAAVELADAAASQNPSVHYLIAKRQQHTLNGDAAAVDAVTAELAELGYK